MFEAFCPSWRRQNRVVIKSTAGRLTSQLPRRIVEIREPRDVVTRFEPAQTLTQLDKCVEPSTCCAKQLAVIPALRFDLEFTDQRARIRIVIEPLDNLEAARSMRNHRGATIIEPLVLIDVSDCAHICAHLASAHLGAPRYEHNTEPSVGLECVVKQLLIANFKDV